MNYSGDIVINARIAGPAAAVSQLAYGVNHRLPTKDELECFLSFLGLHVLSNRLRYDASIPEKYQKPLHDAVNTLNLTDTVAPLSLLPAEKDFYVLLSRSISMARKGINDSIQNIPKSTKPPENYDIDSFFTCLKAMSKEPDENNRFSIAADEFNRGTHGAKALVGLAGTDNSDLLEAITPYEASSNSIKGDVMSMVINNFRTFLLMQLAGNDDAILATNPSGVKQLCEYKLSILDDIITEIRNQFNLNAPLATPDNCSLPLLGLVVLIDAPNNSRPEDLFGLASRFSDDLRVPSIQKNIINLHSSGAGSDKIAEVKEKLVHEIRKRGGPKTAQYSSSIGKAAFEVTPKSLIPLSGPAATIALGADPIQALGGMAAVGVATRIHAVASKISENHSVVGAMCNIMSYDNIVIEAIWSKVEKIWRKCPLSK